jgi:hypothetical protein
MSSVRRHAAATGTDRAATHLVLGSLQLCGAPLAQCPHLSQ